MKAAINPYIKDPIEQGDLICANDVQELRDNVEKLLQFFHEHIGSTVNEYGYDSYPEIRQHAVVTEASNGFAPYTIFKDLDDYKQKYDLLNASFNSDPFPALSIVAWGGDYNDILPEGWIFCDGESVLYEDPENPKKVYYSPDLRYVEPVSVSPSRRFLSRMTGIDRSSATTADGTGVTKYYIIKKPNTYTPPEEPKALLTVIQPKGVRIATNCTTSDREKLFKRKDGSMETVELPYGTDITISTFDSDEYIFEKGKDKLYIKENSKSEKETLRTNTFKLQEDTEVTATSTYDRYTLTLVQPKQVRIYTDEIPKSKVIGLPDGASTSAEVERGNTITVRNVDTDYYQLKTIYTQKKDQSYATELVGNNFKLENNTTVTATVKQIKASIKLIQPIDCRISMTEESKYLPLDATLRLVEDGSQTAFEVQTNKAITFSIFGGIANTLKNIIVKDLNGNILESQEVNIKPYKWGTVSITPIQDCIITGEVELYPYTGFLYQSGSEINSTFKEKSNGIYDAHTGVWATDGKYITIRIPSNVQKVMGKFMYGDYGRDESWSSGAIGNSSTGTTNWWQAASLRPQIERVIKVTPGTSYKICVVCGGGQYSGERAYGDGLVFGTEINSMVENASDFNHL